MTRPTPRLRAFFAALLTATAAPDDHAAFEAARDDARQHLAAADDEAATLRRAFRAVFQTAP